MSAPRVLPAEPAPLASPAELMPRLVEDAWDDVPNAGALRTLFRLTHDTEATAHERMASLCCRLLVDCAQEQEAVSAGAMKAGDLRPWPPSPPELWRRLLGELRAALRRSACHEPRHWQIALALQHGPAWLATAAQLAKREQHRMQRPGGWRLPALKIDGDQLIAELREPETGPGIPSGLVLRLTWGSTAHLIVQSWPGRWAAADPTTEPT